MHPDKVKWGHVRLSLGELECQKFFTNVMIFYFTNLHIVVKIGKQY